MKATGDRRQATGAKISDFRYHKVTEKEKQQIQKDAKKLLNTFAEKLSKIKASEGHFENLTGTREEGNGWKTDDDFKQTTLANAPFTEDNSIIAEKGNWKN